MQDVSPALSPNARQAIDRLYSCFVAAVPPRIEGCPCCIDTRGVDVLLARPRRELTGPQLWRYITGVFLTVGGEVDFNYLLPRIFEIGMTDPADVPDIEIILGKLALAKWRDWPRERQRAIEGAVDAWFDPALARDEANFGDGWPGWETESVMCGASRAGLPLAGWLARLQEPGAAAVLADLRSRYPRELSAFWEETPAGLRELAALLAD